MAKDTCSVKDCTKEVLARGWCHMHWWRWRKYGTTTLPPQPTPEERFWALVDFRGDCWDWTGATTKRGYAMYHSGSRRIWGETMAYRIAWAILVGPIPSGLELDHRCRNIRCVNPDHLEAVSGRTNKLRGFGLTRKHAEAVACPQGHPYEGPNLGLDNRGQRYCRTCARARCRRWHHARKALPD